MKLLAIHTGNSENAHMVDEWRIARPLRFTAPHVDWEITERETLIQNIHELTSPETFTDAELEKAVEDVGQYDVVWGSYTSFLNPMTFALTQFITDKHGTKFVLDVDDNVFAINPDNIGWWFKMSHDKTYDLQTIIRNAQYLTTTNEVLKAELAKRSSATITVIPNYITKAYEQHKPDNGDKLVIGYFGGASHFNDLHQTGMTEAVERIMHRYKHVYFTTCGIPVEDYLPRGRYKYIGGKKGHAWLNEVFPSLQYDISLGPLTDSIFNLSKSDIKWQESAMMGAAFVGSDLGPNGPYNRTVSQNVDGILVKNTAEDWYKALERLVTKPTVRARLVANARRRVKRYMLIEHNWVNIKEALGGIR
jgi:hypothetical protein